MNHPPRRSGRHDRYGRHVLSAAALLLAGLTTNAQAAPGEVAFKVAYIDPLSGPFANVGELMLTHTQFAIEEINAKGGIAVAGQGPVKLQLLQFDSKLSAQESLSALQSAIDQGARAIVTGGSGSSVVAALVQAAAKHNERNPDRAVLVLNHSSIDPDLTGKSCNFWHFQFEANTAMKMKAMANTIKKMPEVKKVYLLNQDYTHGRQVSKAAREYLARKRPDIQIVGDDFIPIAQTRDFASYVAKIASSGADTVITSNWGSDLTLLFKSSRDYGLNINYFTLNANNPGTPAQLGAWGEGKVGVVWNWVHNAPTPELEKIYVDYKKKYNDEFIFAAHWNSMNMLREAMRKAQSTDAKKVALALEGMSYKSPMGEVKMRKTDHQLEAPLYLGIWAKQGSKGVKYDAENTGYGFRSEVAWDSYISAQPTSCQMKRPG